MLWLVNSNNVNHKWVSHKVSSLFVTNGFHFTHRIMTNTLKFFLWFPNFLFGASANCGECVCSGLMHLSLQLGYYLEICKIIHFFDLFADCTGISNMHSDMCNTDIIRDANRNRFHSISGHYDSSSYRISYFGHLVIFLPIEQFDMGYFNFRGHHLVHLFHHRRAINDGR